jgi:hypothetical protein
MATTNLDLLVGFIDFDNDDTDTGLSFAIYEDGDYTESLMLARSTFDQLLSDDEQGTRIHYGDVLDDSFSPVLLQEACLSGKVLELTCESHHFTLDLSKIETDDIGIIEKQLKKFNFDNRFILRINGKKQQPDTTDHMVVAFCWYQPEEWEKLKQSAADAEKLDDTYKEWKKNANDMIRFVRTAGRNVQKINIKIEALEAWCKTEGRENNSAARSHYATAMARQRNSK